MSNTDEEDRPLRLENNEEYGDYEEDEDEGYYRSENDEEYGDEEEDVEEEDYEDDEYGDEEEVEEEDENGGLEEDEEGLLQLFQPTEAQAYSVFNQICEKCPPEITSIILDYAGYWPVKRWLNNNRTRVDGYWCGNGQDGKSQIVHVSTRADNEVDDPLPKRITKIRVRAIAHDQGWAGDRHSWTWGEIVFHYKDGKVTAHDFYRNRTAYDRKQVHEMVFDVGTMECLGSVSKIDVVHFAQFPGWCNYVYSSLIEVSYAVDFQLGD